MNTIYLLRKAPHSSQAIGGKGLALARLEQSGFQIPNTCCLTTSAYDRFLEIGGLRETIQLELHRKQFTEMRWEEIWDVALRVRHHFLTTPFPDDLRQEIEAFLAREFSDTLLAVRSSAPDEDTEAASFAGLHESFLGIHGIEQLLHHLKKVWASLWSDRALLYRQELSLSVEASAMAVVIQEVVAGEVSGVGFSVDPMDESRMVIEAVHGLNQGLVDGQIEPDRYFLDRQKLDLLEHGVPKVRGALQLDQAGVLQTVEEGEGKFVKAPLNKLQVEQLGKTLLELEELLGLPVDMEWTLGTNGLTLLQVRPVTTRKGATGEDKRSWYLTLHRSFGNLQELRIIIEQEMLPTMAREAEQMGGVDLPSLSNSELAREIDHRLERSSFWSRKYWDDCIPFAHGIRLFGEVYNDLLMPEDPYEFVSLLSGSPMLSTERNRSLQTLAQELSNQPEIADQILSGGFAAITDTTIRDGFLELEQKYGNFFSGLTGKNESREAMIMKVVAQYGVLNEPLRVAVSNDRDKFAQKFMEACDKAEMGFSGRELLELGRASYRLRDDDNIYMGRIELQLTRAADEARNRLSGPPEDYQLATPQELVSLLRGEKITVIAKKERTGTPASEIKRSVRARQLLGQPASQGFARGKARVIHQHHEMTEFRRGEVLIVDAIDPNMTFLAPLAAAIVERRGGMLIHGAIIAREYGIPCVTGVSSVAEKVQTGDLVSVDGFLGIVTVGVSEEKEHIERNEQ